MTAATVDQTDLKPGDWYYVTNRLGEVLDVFVIAEPFDAASHDGTDFAWVRAHQRPPGSGWGDCPAAQQVNHLNQEIALMWTRTSH